MADNEIAYEIRADDSQLDSDLKNAEKKIENSLANSKETVKKAVKESEKTVKEGADNSEKAVKDSTEQISKDAEKAGKSTSKIGSAFEKAGSAAKAGLKKLGSAALGMGTDLLKSAVTTAITGADSFDKAMHQFSASTDIAGTELKNYEETLKSIYAGGYGESYEEIAGAMSQVTQEMGKLDQASLQNVTEAGFLLKDTFGYDMAASTQAAAAMMESFGISGEEAMGLIAAGAQNGLDVSGEMLGGISQYSQQFAEAGLSADEMFKVMEQGVETGGGLWETLGPQAAEALNGIRDGAYASGDALQQMKDVQYEDLGSSLDGVKRMLETLLIPLGQQLLPLIQMVIDSVLPPLVDLLELLLPPLTDMIGILLPPLISLTASLIEPLAEILGVVLPPLIDLINTLLEPLMDLISILLPPLISLFEALIKPLADILGAILPPLIEVFDALLEPLMEMIDSLLPPLIGLIDMLMPAFDSLVPVIKVLADILGGVLKNSIDAIMPILDGVVGVLKSIIQYVTGVFSGNWEDAWNGIVGIFKGIFNLIPTIIEGIINHAIGIINGIIKGINALTGLIGIPEIPLIPKVTIPRFHAGGVVDFRAGEGLALLRSGEMVLTQAQQARLFSLANGMGPAGGQTIVVTSPLYLDGREISRNVTQHQYSDVMARRYK